MIYYKPIMFRKSDVVIVKESIHALNLEIQMYIDYFLFKTFTYFLV